MTDDQREVELRIRDLQAQRLKILSTEQFRCYLPHEKQLEQHSSQAKIRGAFWANQTGKSTLGVQELLWTVSKTHPYRPNYSGRVYGRDCCKTFSAHLKAVLVQKYQEFVPHKPCWLDWKTAEGSDAYWPGLEGSNWKSAWDEETRILYLSDGSFIEFKAYDQGREAFEGPPRHIIRMDEEPPYDIWGANLSRQATLKRNVLITGTLLNYSPWLTTDVIERALTDNDVFVNFMDAQESPYISEEYVADMTKEIKDPNELAARLHGTPTFYAGRVFKGYSDANLYDPFPIPRDWHKSVILDPHLSKATGVNWIAEDTIGRLYVYREGDFAGDVHQISQQIIAASSGENIDLYMADPSSKASTKIHNKGPLIDEFRKYFPTLIEANNNRDMGIHAVQRMVSKDYFPDGPGLLVSRACPVTHYQMKNHSWKPPLKDGTSRGKEEVVKRNDEHPDCIRYRCLWGWNQNKGGTKFDGWSLRGYAN